jgi:hypothetical protein
MRTRTTRRVECGSVTEWRREQLIAAGFPTALAREIANDACYDLHALIELVERGCPAELAQRILAPLEERVTVTATKLAQ